MKKVILLNIVVLFFLFTFSCGNDGTVTENDGNNESLVTGIKIITGENVITGKGNMLYLEAEVESSEPITNPVSVNWTSSNTQVATVSQEGAVTAIDYGSVFINASVDEYNSTITITVEKYSGEGNFTIRNGDNTLGGALFLPMDISNTVPAMVIIAGSGPSTREDGEGFAAFLASHGYAAVSYDKRGYGESTGEQLGSVSVSNSINAFDKLSSDAVAWANFLKEHENIDIDKIGLIGTSQAGWIIPLAASKSSDIKFMVNIVGPTVTVGEEIFYSSLTGNDPAGNNLSSYSDEELDSLLANFTGDRGYDPYPYLREVQIPGFWALGEKDYSIPVPKTIRILEDLVNNHGKDYEILILPNANHWLRDISTGELVSSLTSPGGVLDWLADNIN